MTPLMLCLDYDGTLVPIRAHPSQAVLPARTKQLLQRLARLPAMRLVIISGRSLRDLKRRVGIRGLSYVGNHGLEADVPNLRYVHPAARRIRPHMARVARYLRAALRSVPGAWVEDKGLTVSVHWRAVPRRAHHLFRRHVDECLARAAARQRLRVTSGKRVIEVRPPVAWDKGRIITWLLRRAPSPRVGTAPLVIYVGDDQTDEAAFRTVNRLQGTSVRVGPLSGQTAARYRLDGPQEVRAWLTMLART